MVLAQPFPLGLQSLAKEREGLSVPALRLKAKGQIVPAAGCVGVVLSECLAVEREHLLKEWQGLSVLALGGQAQRHFGVTSGRLGVSLPERYPAGL
jgi:hypothetical protein